MKRNIDPLRDLALVPPQIEADLPEDISIRKARLTVKSFAIRAKQLAELIATHSWLHDVQLTDRAGSVGTDLAGALELLRQGITSLDMAADARVLSQRKANGERVSRLMAQKREAFLNKEATDD